MKNPKFRIARFAIVAVVCQFATFPVLATDYRKLSEVKQLIEQTMRQPQPQPVSTAYYYSCCISHFDGFIPYEPGMSENYDQNKPHYKYTYQDGRVVKSEFFDDSGKSFGYYAVWNNSAGAPILSGYFGKDGLWAWYMYADYDSSGKIHNLYRFSADFELQCYYAFSYEGSSTRIQFLSKESKLVDETLYENGEVFSITNGEKKKVNNVDRDQSIRALVKFGLKPIYPGY